MTLEIDESVLTKGEMSAQDILIEIAMRMYAAEKFTMGQVRRFAGIDQIRFQKELAKRGLYIQLSSNHLQAPPLRSEYIALFS
ncbi:MAG: UPF0175 family protein, partial [Bacteroidota bacterium]